MPANGTLCLGWTCLQTRCSAKETGHSLEFNGPSQMREHSLPVIRRKKGLWTDSAVSRNFSPFCCMITIMHMRYTEKPWSYSLEFCPGGLYKSKPQACLLAQFFFLRPELCLSLVCLVFVSFHSQSPTSGAQRGARVKPKGWVTPGEFKSIAGELSGKSWGIPHPSRWTFGKSWGIPHHHYGHSTWS